MTFDLATSLYRSGTNHDHDQPAHLKLKSPGAIQTVNVEIYDRPETRYCPAGVSHGQRCKEDVPQNMQPLMTCAILHVTLSMHCAGCKKGSVLEGMWVCIKVRKH